MNTFNRPSLALRPQRDSLRHKQIHAVRTRTVSANSAAVAAEHGSALDSVFKRFPAFGDIPAARAQG